MIRTVATPLVDGKRPLRFLSKKAAKALVWLALAAMLAALAACGNNTAAINEDGIPETLYVSVIVGDNNREAQDISFEEFRLALEDYIGIPVEMKYGITHLVAIEAMRAGNLHLMWGSPFVYLLAQQTMEVERLVTTTSDTAINKALFVTAHDDIQTMEDMEGRSFAFVTTSSTAGFMYPMYYLINRYDLSRDEILTPGVLFSDVIFSGGNNPSLSGIANGDFDAGAIGQIQLDNAIRAGIINEGDLRVLGDTPNIPWPGYIATTNLSPALRRQIQSFLLSWDSDDYSAARFNDPAVRYVAADDSVIPFMRSMIEVLEIDLEAQN